MRSLLRAELIRVTGTPSTWWLAGLAFAAVLLGLALTLPLQEVAPGDDVHGLLTFATAAGLVTMLLGVVTSAGEFRHHTIVASALVAPRRTAAFEAQVLVQGAIGMIVGCAATALAFAVAAAWLGAQGTPLGVSSGEVLLVALGTTWYCGVASVAGTGLGALVKNQVVAVIALLIYLAMVDPLLAQGAPSYGQFGPTALGIAITGAPAQESGPASELLPAAIAVAVWCGYAAVLAAAGLAAIRRRDLP